MVSLRSPWRLNRVKREAIYRPERNVSCPVFEPLRDPAVFSQFEIHNEFRTLVWPNGADFAPEFLHDHVRITT